jgi:hypothetical protein
MSAQINAGGILFSNIERNFERSDIRGTVQVLSEQPAQKFFITVDRASLAYLEGIWPDPAATVWMRSNLLLDLVLESHRYDARDVKFASRLAISGNIELVHRLLDLTKTPTAETLALLKQSKEKVQEKPIEKVERVHYPDRNYLYEAMEDFRPVIMSGLLDRWKVWSWSPGVLHTHFGDSQIAPFLPGTIRDLVATMMAPAKAHGVSSPRYTGGVSLPPVFWKHFPPPQLLEGIVDAPQFWLGSTDDGEKPVTGLHCDCRHGFLCQVFGKKRVVLYSPDQEHLVYAYRAFNTHRPCWTGPDTRAFDRYPLFKQAQALEVIVKPGETLFIPAGWFHCVFALDPVMSISMAVVGPSANPRSLAMPRLDAEL